MQNLCEFRAAMHCAAQWQNGARCRRSLQAHFQEGFDAGHAHTMEPSGGKIAHAVASHSRHIFREASMQGTRTPWSPVVARWCMLPPVTPGTFSGRLRCTPWSPVVEKWRMLSPVTPGTFSGMLRCRACAHHGAQWWQDGICCRRSLQAHFQEGFDGGHAHTMEPSGGKMAHAVAGHSRHIFRKASMQGMRTPWSPMVVKWRTLSPVTPGTFSGRLRCRACAHHGAQWW